MPLSLNDNMYSKLGELARFGVVGFAAMLIHYGIYYCLSSIMNLNLAFTLGYAVSFIFNFFASSYFTFKVSPSVFRLMKFGASHGINYLLQIIIFNIALYLGVKAKLAPVMVYMISIPASFLMVRFAMKNSLKKISASNVKMLVLAAVIIAVYVLTLFHSSGYYYPDEHYQLIEFARWKMGVNMPDAVPWELRSEIRPSIQPVITMLLLRAMELFGIDNPFRQVFVLRCVMAIVMTFAVWRFTVSTKLSLNSENRLGYVALSFLLWFIPYLSVRYSSETMAAAFLLMGLAEIYNIWAGYKELSGTKVCVIGALLCFAFEFRYQMAFAIAGIVLWAIFIARIRFSRLLAFVAAFGFVFVLCSICDAVFYGHWTLTPWNYFRENIINGVASSFGTSPWYDYFVMVYKSAAPFVGIIISLSVVYAILSRPKNPIVWVLVSFVTGHIMVAHKELRFLFPMAFLLPLLIMWMTERLSRFEYGTVRRLMVMLFLFINTGGLVVLALKPARYGRAGMLEYIYHNPDIRKVICSRDNNIYKVSTLSLDFYRRKGMVVDEDMDSFILEIRQIKKGDVFILNQGDVWRREQASALGLKEIYKSIPSWMDYVNKFYKTYNPNEVKIAYGMI